jgi:hypothetical protein
MIAKPGSSFLQTLGEPECRPGACRPGSPA